MRDAAIVDDACGISFDVDEWTVLGSDYIYLNANSDGSYGADMELEDINPNGGVGASVTLPPLLDDDTTFSMQVELEKSGTVDAAPIFFDYEHTWAWTDLDPTIEILISELYGSAFLEVLLENAETLWEANLDAPPGGEDSW